MTRQFKFVGDGAGVPGLPHRISDEEAGQKGLAELLQAAVEAGNYVEEYSSHERDEEKPATKYDKSNKGR